MEQAISSENLEQTVQYLDNIKAAYEMKLTRRPHFVVERWLKTWFISDLKAFRRKTRKAERVYYMKCDSVSWSKYKKQWNLLSRKLKDSKQKVISDQVQDCEDDREKLFVLLNSLLERNKNENLLP